MFQTIHENYCDTIPEDHLQMILFIGLSMVVPEGQGGNGEEDNKNWLLMTKSTFTEVAKLVCPMSGSTLYVNAIKKNSLKTVPGGKAGKGEKEKAKAKIQK